MSTKTSSRRNVSSPLAPHGRFRGRCTALPPRRDSPAARERTGPARRRDARGTGLPGKRARVVRRHAARRRRRCRERSPMVARWESAEPRNRPRPPRPRARARQRCPFARGQRRPSETSAALCPSKLRRPTGRSQDRLLAPRSATDDASRTLAFALHAGLLVAIALESQAVARLGPRNPGRSRLSRVGTLAFPCHAS